MENEDYRKKKSDELQKKLSDAHSSIHHIELVQQFVFPYHIMAFGQDMSTHLINSFLSKLAASQVYFHVFSKQIDKVKLEVKQFQEFDIKRAMANESMRVNLDIPESVGLSTPVPNSSSSRLLDLDNRRRGKRRI